MVLYYINDVYYLYRHPIGYTLVSREDNKPTSVIAHLNKSGGDILSFFENGKDPEELLSHVMQKNDDILEFINHLIIKKVLIKKPRKYPALIGSDSLFLPITLQLEVTERCVQACKHCYINNIKFPEILDISSIEIILNKLRIYNLPLNIQITGGEPFLRDDIWEILDMVDNYSNIRWAIYTTGILIDENTSYRLSQYKNLYEIHVSLDGNEKLHDALRGKGSYKKTLRGIKYLIRYNKDKIKIATMLRHGLVKTIIDETVKIITQMGISLDRLEMGYIIPVGRGEVMKNEILTMDEFTEGLKLLKNYEIKHGDLYRWENEIKFFTSEEIKNTPHKLGIGGGNCGAGYISVAIAPNGDVYPCTIMVSYPQFKIGNIFRDPLEKIFMKEVKKWVYRKTPSPESCNGCKYLPYCNKCFGYEIAFCKNPGWLLYEK